MKKTLIVISILFGTWAHPDVASANTLDISCPKGQYVSFSSRTCVKCWPGHLCSGNQDQPVKCTAGNYCTDGVKSQICPPNTYCPEGSGGPIKCPNYTFSNAGSTSAYDCIKPEVILECPVGQYMSIGKCVVCYEGQMCEGGAAQPVDCPAGSYCVDGIATICPENTYCPTGNTNNPIKCLEGTRSGKGSKSGADCIAI